MVTAEGTRLAWKPTERVGCTGDEHLTTFERQEACRSLIGWIGADELRFLQVLQHQYLAVGTPQRPNACQTPTA